MEPLTAEVDAVAASVETGRTVLPWRGDRQQEGRFGWGPWVALVVVGILLVLAVFPGVLSPDNPVTQNIGARLQGPSASHLLGTDVDGRDVLSRIIWGARDAIEGVAIALAGATVLGVPWGLVAGYGGGVVDEVVMRIADAILSIPGIVLAIAITGILGPSLRNSMLAVGFVFAPIIARLLRSAVLPIRNAEFVMVARSFGLDPVRVSVRHVLPNAFAPVLVQLFGLASLSFIIEAALAFLGLGVQAPNPAWGADLQQAYTNFTAAPLTTVAPGLIITVAALCVSVIGDGVRNRLLI
jgi:peptide/nickel transport system permease protein